MADIGASLRNARTSAGIDISEIEAETKIRAKYLRALENEEWAQLPGPTYVRSFMRTYADALGLDGRMLVEEYKLRHERPSDQDLMPISPPRRAQRRPQRRRMPRWAVILTLVGVLILALVWLGLQKPKSNGAAPATTVSRSAGRTAGTAAKPKAAVTATALVRVRLSATGPVFVCLQDAKGARRVDGATLKSGQRTRTYSSRSFLLRLGNGNVRVVVDGRVRRVSNASPQAYKVTRSGLKRIALSSSPSCA